MDGSKAQSATNQRRRPLGDAKDRVNLNITPPRRPKSRPAGSPASSNGLQHHESMAANGALTVQNLTNSPENKRISAISEERADSKRNSQVSTTSTNASSKGMRRKTHIGPWQLGCDVGKGGTGKVRKVRHKITGQNAAAKIIRKKTAEMARAESLMTLVESAKNATTTGIHGPLHVLPFGIEREVVIMKLLEHPNVVRLYDVWENRNELYLIMEYVDGGELFEYVEKSNYLEEDETVWIFRQIVAALLHCHRLGIHHRDLKPENILLSCQTEPETGRMNPQVKLADFGMAALQPKGKMLTTPCGSLHYAAPEVFEKVYDGAKVDVWSLGIILFVMLTGMTPFQFQPDSERMPDNFSSWYRLLKSGQFHMPPELSREAQDLINRMLVPDPSRRISLEMVWKHPLFTKWSSEWGEDANDVTIEAWIGTSPTIASWHIRSRNDIDREILRNLRSLWHSVKEETLMEKLLSKDVNQEKYFYSALERHREEQLENYVGIGASITYSSSDYHHVKPIMEPDELPPIPATAYIRTKSSFSIMNDDPTSYKPSPPPSIGSYDPFRASRDHLVNSKGEYNVTVRRRSSAHSRRLSNNKSLKCAPSLRVEALKKEQHRLLTGSSAQSLRRPSPSPRPRSSARRSQSRMSMSSSIYPSSPPGPIVKRPSSTHKRAVNFSHLRRSSTISAFPIQDSLLGAIGSSPHPLRSTTPTTGFHTPHRPTPSSPTSKTEDILPISRKEGLAGGRPRARLAKSQIDSQVIDLEARKVSTELEKFCEEVFFRTSVASSNSGTVSQMKTSYETPPSSVSNRESLRSSYDHAVSALTQERLSLKSRPLPEVPAESPNTFVVRELAETRKRLAERYGRDDSIQSPAFTNLLAHIDALLLPSTNSDYNADTRRIASAPETKSSDYLSYLPRINEETKTTESETNGIKYGWAVQGARASSESVVKPHRTALSKLTVRPVEQSSPPHIAPLVIRKVSSTSTDGGSLQLRTERNPGLYTASSGSNRSEHLRRASRSPSGHLHTISEESTNAKEAAATKHDMQTGRKRSWFRRRLGATDQEDNRATSKLHISSSGDRSRSVLDDPLTTSENPPLSPIQGLPGKRPGFLAFLNKKRMPKPAQSRMVIGGPEDEESVDSRGTSLVTATTRAPPVFRGQNHRPNEHSTDSEVSRIVEVRDLGVQRNWLARFLNIKPASKLLSLNTGRGRARQELVRLLRSWRTYGMRDVELDRERNLIFGRLASGNYLGIKEVSFVVELFVVLEHGRHVNLSLARFTQRKGAASSFREVFGLVETMMQKRDMLVRNAEKREEMEGILTA